MVKIIFMVILVNTEIFYHNYLLTFGITMNLLKVFIYVFLIMDFLELYV